MQAKVLDEREFKRVLAVDMAQHCSTRPRALTETVYHVQYY